MKQGGTWASLVSGQAAGSSNENSAGPQIQPGVEARPQTTPPVPGAPALGAASSATAPAQAAQSAGFSYAAAAASGASSQAAPAIQHGHPSAKLPPPTRSQQQQRLMAQAARSKKDPVTGKMRCLACGVAFSTYMQLAQHLEAKHGGINSEDVKYAALVQAQQQAGSRSGAGSSTQAPTATNTAWPSLRPTERSAGSAGGVSKVSQRPKQATAASAMPIKPSGRQPKPGPANPVRAPKAGGVKLLFGLVTRAAAPSRPPATGTGHRAAAAGAGSVALLPKRRRLRVEGAVRKKRVSHAKRIVLQQRVEREWQEATQALQQAEASQATVQAFHNQLQQELTALLDCTAAAAGPPSSAAREPGPSTEQLTVSAATAGTSAAASSSPPAAGLISSTVPPAVRAAVLQLKLNEVNTQLAARQQAVTAASERVTACEKKRAALLKQPVEPEAGSAGPSQPAIIAAGHAVPDDGSSSSSSSGSTASGTQSQASDFEQADKSEGAHSCEDKSDAAANTRDLVSAVAHAATQQAAASPSQPPTQQQAFLSAARAPLQSFQLLMGSGAAGADSGSDDDDDESEDDHDALGWIGMVPTLGRQARPSASSGSALFQQRHLQPAQPGPAGSSRQAATSAAAVIGPAAPATAASPQLAASAAAEIGPAAPATAASPQLAASAAATLLAPSTSPSTRGASHTAAPLTATPSVVSLASTRLQHLTSSSSLSTRQDTGLFSLSLLSRASTTTSTWPNDMASAATQPTGGAAGAHQTTIQSPLSSSPVTSLLTAQTVSTLTSSMAHAGVLHLGSVTGTTSTNLLSTSLLGSQSVGVLQPGPSARLLSDPYVADLHEVASDVASSVDMTLGAQADGVDVLSRWIHSAGLGPQRQSLQQALSRSRQQEQQQLQLHAILDQARSLLGQGRGGPSAQAAAGVTAGPLGSPMGSTLQQASQQQQEPQQQQQQQQGTAAAHGSSAVSAQHAGIPGLLLGGLQGLSIMDDDDDDEEDDTDEQGLLGFDTSVLGQWMQKVAAYNLQAGSSLQRLTNTLVQTAAAASSSLAGTAAAQGLPGALPVLAARLHALQASSTSISDSHEQQAVSRSEALHRQSSRPGSDPTVAAAGAFPGLAGPTQSQQATQQLAPPSIRILHAAAPRAAQPPAQPDHQRGQQGAASFGGPSDSSCPASGAPAVRGTGGESALRARGTLLELIGTAQQQQQEPGTSSQQRRLTRAQLAVEMAAALQIPGSASYLPSLMEVGQLGSSAAAGASTSGTVDLQQQQLAWQSLGLAGMPSQQQGLPPGLLHLDSSTFQQGVGFAGSSQMGRSTGLACELCRVQCNSTSALQQHLASKKHLTRVARKALLELEAAAPHLVDESEPGGSGATYVGPDATSHHLCKQIISPELNTVTTELLTRIKGFQERAMLKDPIKAAAHRWYVCGLREVRKACRAKKAKSVIVAPNIEEVAVDGGLDDHLEEILKLCEENSIAVVFALTRKKLGEIYGHRKRVSAVAVLGYNGVDDLHAQMLQLATAGKEEFAHLPAQPQPLTAPDIASAAPSALYRPAPGPSPATTGAVSMPGSSRATADISVPVTAGPVAQRAPGSSLGPTTDPSQPGSLRSVDDAPSSRLGPNTTLPQGSQAHTYHSQQGTPSAPAPPPPSARTQAAAALTHPSPPPMQTSTRARPQQLTQGAPQGAVFNQSGYYLQQAPVTYGTPTYPTAVQPSPYMSQPGFTAASNPYMLGAPMYAPTGSLGYPYPAAMALPGSPWVPTAQGVPAAQPYGASVGPQYGLAAPGTTAAYSLPPWQAPVPGPAGQPPQGPGWSAGAAASSQWPPGGGWQ